MAILAWFNQTLEIERKCVGGRSQAMAI